MELDREIVELEAKLAEVPKWEARVNELERLYGQDFKLKEAPM